MVKIVTTAKSDKDWETARKLYGEDLEKMRQIIDAAAEAGVKFGIWIEPEMTNCVSELYEKHPDWVICHPDRTPIGGRGGTQLVLDMSNPAVQDFVFKVVATVSLTVLPAAAV